MTPAQRLPGLEVEHHEDVTKAAKIYVAARDERAELTEREDKVRGFLLEKMRKHKLTVYEDEDANVRVEVTEGKTKVKVKRLEEEPVG